MRQGSWRIRVPVQEFEAFREAVLKIGEVEKATSDSQDITEEFADLEQHIKNKLAEEEGLRKFLEKTTDKMESFLAVRRELNQLRDEIDRQQGKQKRQADLSEMSAINLFVRERQRYVPEKGPDPAETPTFAMRIRRAFTGSLDALAELGQGLAVAVVALAPWLPLLLAAAAACWFVRRRRLANPARSSVGTQPKAG